MPDFPLIDTHMHLWDPKVLRISWLGGELLNRRYELPEYREHTRGVDIEAMVYVEVNVDPAYGLVEARRVAQQAQEDPRIQGIVAWAPIDDGECVRSYLNDLTRISPLIKGVRRNLQGETDLNFCLRPDFLKAIQILPEYGLSFDACVVWQQLPAVIEMVRLCPDTAFMLDHIAKPDIKSGQIEPWGQYIQQLATYPNVMCKVSGMVTEADPQNWTSADLAPYANHVLTSFGEDRVAFGGDWPVVLLASQYTRWVKALDELTAHLSIEAKRKLWVENARRFYRLSSIA